VVVSPQALFALAFPLAVPFWALMIFAPGWSWTRRIIASPLIVVPPLLVYVALLVPQFAAFAGPVVSADLPGLAAVLGTPAGAAAIWAHAIGFDLFVGRWMYLDSREREVHPLVMAPILVLTILLSPLGLLAYLALRTLLPTRTRVDEMSSP
jgi:Domain of unknown function (DUF4281)